MPFYTLGYSKVLETWDCSNGT